MLLAVGLAVVEDNATGSLVDEGSLLIDTLLLAASDELGNSLKVELTVGALELAVSCGPALVDRRGGREVVDDSALTVESAK